MKNRQQPPRQAVDCGAGLFALIHDLWIRMIQMMLRDPDNLALLYKDREFAPPWGFAAAVWVLDQPILLAFLLRRGACLGSNSAAAGRCFDALYLPDPLLRIALRIREPALLAYAWIRERAGHDQSMVFAWSRK